MNIAVTIDRMDCDANDVAGKVSVPQLLLKEEKKQLKNGIILYFLKRFIIWVLGFPLLVVNGNLICVLKQITGRYFWRQTMYRVCVYVY